MWGDGGDPIQEAAQAIVDLGISSFPALQPHLDAWRHRPPSEDTSDEDVELARFITALHTAGILNRNQGRALLAMLDRRAPSAAVTDDPYIGRRFGSYVTEAKIGEGGMGLVYRAARVGALESHYVVKVLTPGQDAQASARFRRECEVMASLDHPNIVKVFAAGQEGNLPYLVLEYVEGPTLQQMVEERGKFAWKSATRAIKQIASALAGAHEQGVIHRDIKPHNILVARGGILKVFDFGLAKTTGTKTVSHAGEILGSPAYMAPEQWGDHEVDHRVDLYALGVVYYLLLTGTLPYKGRTPADYSWRIQAGKYEPPRSLVPDLPPSVGHVVAQLLERDRNCRPPHARALLADLDRVMRGQFPDVPRLEPIDEATREPRLDLPVVALIGAQAYEVGSLAGQRVHVAHGSVAPSHAVLERTVGGLLLRDLESPTGVRVNGHRLREVVLRDKDRIQFGDGPILRYRIGHGSKKPSGRYDPPSSDSYRTLKKPSSKSGPEDQVMRAVGPPLTVPALLAAALEDAAHPRAVVACIEALDTRTVLSRLEASRRRLERLGVAEDEAARILERARVAAQERVWRIVDRLFRTTRENLGRQVEAWLAWWIEACAQYPQQLRAPGPRARGRLSISPSPEEKPFTVDLHDHERWTLGRSDEADIVIPERSVSRLHLAIARLNTRFAFQDLGSRFGTALGGQRRDVGLLAGGDVLDVGRCRVTFEESVDTSNVDTAVRSNLVGIDAASFAALVDLRSPATVATLVRLLDAERLLDACLIAASPHEEPTNVRPAVTTFLEDQRAMALEALPAITREQLGDDPAAWQGWLDLHREELPPQVEPTGWGD